MGVNYLTRSLLCLNFQTMTLSIGKPNPKNDNEFYMCDFPDSQSIDVNDTTLFIPGHGIVDVLGKIQKLDMRILEVRKEKALQDAQTQFSIKFLRKWLEESEQR